MFDFIHISVSSEMENNDLQRDFMTFILSIIQEIDRGSYQEAYYYLHQFYNLNKSRDKSSWLEKQCLNWKGITLEKMGRFSQSLDVYRTLNQIEGISHFDYVSNCNSIVRLLCKLELTTEAMDEAKRFLNNLSKFYNENNDSILDVLPLLSDFVDLLEALNFDFPEDYLFLVDAIKNELAYDFGTDDNWDYKHLVKIMHLENKEANKRYGFLLVRLNQNFGLTENELVKYISEEKIGYYRNLAQKELENLNNFL
jgi:hypothetical protein